MQDSDSNPRQLPGSLWLYSFGLSGSGPKTLQEVPEITYKRPVSGEKPDFPTVVYTFFTLGPLVYSGCLVFYSISICSLHAGFIAAVG